MESLQAARCCTWRSIAAMNIQLHSSSTPPRTLRHPLGRRKPHAALGQLRPISTTSPKAQEENATSPSPRPQAQRTQPSSAPRPSAWASLIQGPRPHGVTPAPIKTDAAGLSAMITQQTNMLDFVKKPPSSTGSYDSSLTSRVGSDLARTRGRANHDSLEGIHLPLSPTLGRTLPVEEGNGLDLQGAFRVLEIRCAQNCVKKDSITQRTHVRRGQKRKELKSKRWRAMFKEGFIREVARVRRMKAQGW